MMDEEAAELPPDEIIEKPQPGIDLPPEVIEQLKEACTKPKKFSGHHAAIKLTCRKFLIWVVSTVLIFVVIFRNGIPMEIMKILAIGWVVISGVYFIGDCIVDAIVKAVGNISTNINLGRGQDNNQFGGW